MKIGISLVDTRTLIVTFHEENYCKKIINRLSLHRNQRRPRKISMWNAINLGWLEKWNNSLTIHFKLQKQPSRSVLRKRCSENMQQIYWRIGMPTCDFNKAATAWVFSCKFAAYLWTAVSEARNCIQFFVSWRNFHW